MNEHNANNERIKRQYFTFLKEAKGRGKEHVDAAAMALARFEAYHRQRDFKSFNLNQAVAFKEHLESQNNRATGQKLSKATIKATLAQLKAFLEWLALQPEYKSRISYTDIQYFNYSDKDSRIASARRPQVFPTLEQVCHVLRTMPAETEIEMRDRALVAFTLLSGARDGAIASFKLKHVDLAAGNVFQDAREVKTKFGKSFPTYFFPVGGDALTIFSEWVRYLRCERLYGNDNPLFPKTQMAVDRNGQWEVRGLTSEHWSNATAIRRIFREAFALAGLPYFRPHSFRNTLVRLGESLCSTPEQFKAWSQNLGHEGVLTTFTSYGQVAQARQGEIIQALRAGKRASGGDGADEVAAALLRNMLEMGLVSSRT